MREFASIALLSGIMALGAATTTTAQTVERSGRVYHIRACPAFEGPLSARCHAHIVTDSRGKILVFNASRNATPAGYSPAQLRGAYGVTGMGSSTTTVAIVDAYGYPTAAADLATYRAQFKLPPASLTIVSQTGTSKLPKTNTGWDQEQALDLDMVSTMCPNCKILLVQATTASDANLGTAVNEAASLGAHVISNSYGGGESGTSSYDADYNHAGVAVTASAGDSGYGAEFPATSEFVTAVGGTSLTVSNSNTWVSETVWSDSYGGTGSGCSTVYAKPAWQATTYVDKSSNTMPMLNNTLCTKRVEADVSADADPDTGVSVYGPTGGRGSGWMVFGGTSVAAPLIGGIYGERAGLDGGVNYGQNPYNAPAGSLHDITSGSNGSCSGSYLCTAKVGYDGPTGLGTPDGDTAF